MNASPVMLIIGYGPGISRATARRFGREGFRLALIARNQNRLTRGVDELRADGFAATAFAADASDPEALRRAVGDARQQVGPITTVLWTAFGYGAVPDVLAANASDVTAVFDLGVGGLLTCVQSTLDDLTDDPKASLLVINGSLGERTDAADVAATRFDADGVALENAAKYKLVGLLRQRLQNRDIFVGEVTIAGSIAGTETASATAIKPDDVAETLWTMTQQRNESRIRLEDSPTQ